MIRFTVAVTCARVSRPTRNTQQTRRPAHAAAAAPHPGAPRPRNLHRSTASALPLYPRPRGNRAGGGGGRGGIGPKLLTLRLNSRLTGTPTTRPDHCMTGRDWPNTAVLNETCVCRRGSSWWPPPRLAACIYSATVITLSMIVTISL